MKIGSVQEARDLLHCLGRVMKAWRVEEEARLEITWGEAFKDRFRGWIRIWIRGEWDWHLGGTLMMKWGDNGIKN